MISFLTQYKFFYSLVFQLEILVDCSFTMMYELDKVIFADRIFQFLFLCCNHFCMFMSSLWILVIVDLRGNHLDHLFCMCVASVQMSVGDILVW